MQSKIIHDKRYGYMAKDANDNVISEWFFRLRDLYDKFPRLAFASIYRPDGTIEIL